MTLVDVVMAVALLGVMASGIFGSFRYGFFTLQLVRENQRATQILLEKVETIRLYSWDQVQPTNNFIPAIFPGRVTIRKPRRAPRGRPTTGRSPSPTAPLAPATPPTCASSPLP